MEIRIKEVSKEESFEWFNLLVESYAYYTNLSMKVGFDPELQAELQAIAGLLKEYHDVGEL